MQANTFIYNLKNSKKNVVLNQNGENNKIMKYIGGDNIVYKNIFLENENNLDYYGKIYENGNTLNLESENISLHGNLGVHGDLDLNCNNLIDVNGITFCDGSYIRDGNLSINRVIEQSREPYPLSIYVSKSGNDLTGTGSESNPFLTIQRAITLVEQFPSSSNPWEFPSIYVDAGFYDEKITITKNVNIFGINEFLSKNLANFSGIFSTRIGSLNNFVDIRSSVSPHNVRFENIDFRCRITNMEEGTPLNRLLLTMSFCNINKSSDSNPLLYISGVNSTSQSILYISNVRSNGTCTSSTLAAYELPNTSLNIEDCRWNGTASAVGMMRLSVVSTFINCEIRQIAVGSGITNLPCIVLNFIGSPIIRFTNTVLTMEYSATKTSGANILTVPSDAPFLNSQTPTIILDNCFMNITNATPTNFILKNNSGKNIRLQFHRVNTISASTGSNGIDYTNISVTETSSILTSTNNFLGPISMNNNLVNNLSGINTNNNIIIRTGTTPTDRFIVKSNGAIRYVPLSSPPTPAEAGDVYYDSTINRLRFYDGSNWLNLST